MLPHIERYEVTEEIGHGGMATVYRARDERLDRQVAVKVMHPHLRGAHEARARFAREARAVASLKHPAILEIYDYSGLESDNAFIVAELLTGPTLREFAERHAPLPPEVAACVGIQLAGALAAAHAQDIVHRDVKPENVLLHEGRCIKLTDFGIAGMLDPNMSAMTATGQILGSPAHMSPEQIEHGDADARADLFALGTILYLLAVGELPFDGKNPHQVLKRVVEVEPADPLQRCPAMGSQMRDIILRCLRKEPDARFASARQLSDALTEYVRRSGVDKPEQTLAEFLSDPEACVRPLREGSCRALLAAAQQSAARGERHQAIDDLNRVLAMDDGNAAALALLERMTRRSRAPLAAACVAVAVAGALGWLGLRGPADPAPAAAATAATGAAAAAAPAPAPPREAPRDAAAAAVVPTLPEPAQVAATTPIRDNSVKRARPARRAKRRVRGRPLRPSDRVTGERTIRFRPQPQNVSIGVDGAELRPFGPSFRSVALPAGKHSFRFVGAHECCIEQTVELNVPGGSGETEVRVRLEFRPAGLYVRSNVPADVSVDDGGVIGRSHGVIQVPVRRSLRERHRISVTAVGHEPYTGYVQLRAGKLVEHPVTLDPSAAASATP